MLLADDIQVVQFDDLRRFVFVVFAQPVLQKGGSRGGLSIGRILVATHERRRCRHRAGVGGQLYRAFRHDGLTETQIERRTLLGTSRSRGLSRDPFPLTRSWWASRGNTIRRHGAGARSRSASSNGNELFDSGKQRLKFYRFVHIGFGAHGELAMLVESLRRGIARHDDQRDGT